MSTLSKVILGFVVVAALGFFYMAARTLKTHDAWRTAVKNHEVKLAETMANAEKVLRGDPNAAAPQDKKSLSTLQADRYAAISGRGRVWRDCTPKVNPANGEARVATPLPTPNGIKKDDILYVFDGADMATGRYLGEFKVTQVAAQEVLLQPALTLGPPELLDLARSRGPWTLYEVMPADGPDVFAGLSDDELKGFMPKRPQRLAGESDDQFQKRQLAYNAVVKEFEKNGKPPAEDDPPERIRISVRFAKDYDQLAPQDKQAVDQLKVPKEVVKAGEEVTFDKATAEVFTKMEAAQETGRRYERRWRDYAFYLRELNRQMPIWQDRVAAETKNNQYMEKAVADAKTHVTFNNDEIAVLKVELDRVKEEAAAVNTYMASLTEKLQTAQAEIQKLRATNVQLVRELGEAQRAVLQRASQTAAITPAAAAK